MTDMIYKLPDQMFEPAAFMRLEGTWDLPELDAGCDIYRFSAPIVWYADITNTGEAFVVSGKATATGTTACARCLEDATYNLEGEIEDYILTGEDAESPEEGDDDEDYDVLPENHELDMEPLIVAALLMEVPLIPLCREDCAGLCQRCGANLNEGPCDCPPPDDTDMSPFAALKAIKFDE